MNRPTVRDIAREAGVSLATVDRVLNGRPGVREPTIVKVHDAVRLLGYVRDTYAANLARKRQYRFVFVLPEGPSEFTDMLRSALSETRATQIADRMLVETVTTSAHDPHAVVRTLKALDTTELCGVAVMVPETPQVRDAVARLKNDGLAVVTLVSDLPHSERDYFIGINSVAAGRTAAQLMGRFTRTSGDILVITNSMRSRDSLERRLGFDAVMTQDFPSLNVLPSVESFDDPSRIDEVIGRIVANRPRLAGVYSMGTGNTRILSALRQSDTLRELVVIVHELTPAMRRALLNDEIAAVISQNVGHLARSTLRVLRSLSDEVPISVAQERLRIEIVLRENIPDLCCPQARDP